MMNDSNPNATLLGSQKLTTQAQLTSDNGHCAAHTAMSSIDTDISDLLKDTFDTTSNKCNSMLKTVALYNALELTADKSLLSREGEIDRSLSEILDDLKRVVQADDITNNNVSSTSFIDHQGDKYEDPSKSLMEIQEEHQYEMEIERIERLRNPRFQTMPAYKKRAKQEAQWKAAIRAAKRAQKLDTNKNVGLLSDFFKIEDDVVRNQETYGHRPILPKLEFPVPMPSATLDLTCLDLPSETNTSSDDDCVIIEPETAFQNPSSSCSIPRPAKTNLMINTKKHLSSSNHFPANSRIFNRSLQELQSTADAISYKYLTTVPGTSVKSFNVTPRLNFGIQNSREVIDVDEDEVNSNLSVKQKRSTTIPIKRPFKKRNLDFIDSEESEHNDQTILDKLNSTNHCGMIDSSIRNQQSTAVKNHHTSPFPQNSQSTSFLSTRKKYCVSVPLPPEHDYTINCSNLLGIDNLDNLNNLDSLSAPTDQRTTSSPYHSNDQAGLHSTSPISVKNERHIPVSRVPTYSSIYKNAAINRQDGPAKSTSFTRSMINDKGIDFLNSTSSHDAGAASGKLFLNNNIKLLSRKVPYVSQASHPIHKKQRSCPNCLKLAKYLPFISYSRRKETATDVSYGRIMLLCEVCGLFVRETVISGDKMKLDHVSASNFPSFLLNNLVVDSNDPRSQNFIWLPRL